MFWKKLVNKILQMVTKMSQKRKWLRHHHCMHWKTTNDIVCSLKYAWVVHAINLEKIYYFLFQGRAWCNTWLIWLHACHPGNISKVTLGAIEELISVQNNDSDKLFSLSGITNTLPYYRVKSCFLNITHLKLIK